MKKIRYSLLAGLLVLAFTSCEKFLDVNDPNPNSATYSTPELVLPQATAYVASNFVSLHGYGSRLIGYHVNAGGYGGWGDTFTYEYTTSSHTGFWQNSYDNILDLEYIINNATEPEYANFVGVSKILKAFLYQQLVDEYNNIPYTEGAKGAEFITPVYDNAEDVYRSLSTLIDEGISDIKNATLPNPLASADVLFDGDMEKWIQFANTIKLRLYVRAHGNGVFDGNPTITEEGFLTDDALVNPGYQRLDGKQNPTWNSYHSTYTATAQVAFGRQWLPSTYAVTFYNGNKISDDGRGSATYREFPDVPTNHLGNTPTPDNLPTVSGTLGSSPFYIGTPGDNTGAQPTIGTLKGSGMGQPILLAAESYFLQAEGVLKGLISGDLAELFNAGIEASFRYLYKEEDGSVSSDLDPVADAEAYLNANASSRLVNINLASSDEERLEAIITQKYIAYNNIGGHVAWAEFRRTGYPAIVANGTPQQTFVSTRTTMTTPDRLPGRILYPITEFSLNQDNVPTGISVAGSYVFWDRRN